MWDKSDGTKFLAPTASQRSDYIIQVRKQVSSLGKSGKLWQDRDSATALGMEAVHEFLLGQENEALATQLRDTASKLTSAAAHISSPYPSAISYVPSSSLKRKREENLGKVEETLLEAVRVVRDVKKAEQCYQPLQMGPLANKDTPSAASLSAPSTRTLAKISSPEGVLKMPPSLPRLTDLIDPFADSAIASEDVAPQKKLSIARRQPCRKPAARLSSEVCGIVKTRRLTTQLHDEEYSD